MLYIDSATNSTIADFFINDHDELSFTQIGISTGETLMELIIDIVMKKEILQKRAHRS